MTVDDLKAHLNIDHDDDDDLLTAKLAVAESWVKSHVNVTAFNFGNSPELIEATLQLAASLYAQREATSPVELTAVPFGVWDLITPFRQWSF